jgi:hypothetical protein
MARSKPASQLGVGRVDAISALDKVIHRGKQPGELGDATRNASASASVGPGTATTAAKANAPSVSPQRPSPLADYELTDWFAKDPERVGRTRRRFFTLRGMAISYYVSETLAKLKGSFVLTPACSVLGSGKILTINTPSRTWRLTADKEGTVGKWQTLLSKNLQAMASVSVTNKQERTKLLADDIKLLQKEGMGDSSVVFSIWDLAGQTVFYDVLQILLTP